MVKLKKTQSKGDKKLINIQVISPDDSLSLIRLITANLIQNFDLDIDEIDSCKLLITTMVSTIINENQKDLIQINLKLEDDVMSFDILCKISEKTSLSINKICYNFKNEGKHFKLITNTKSDFDASIINLKLVKTN